MCSGYWAKAMCGLSLQKMYQPGNVKRRLVLANLEKTLIRIDMFIMSTFSLCQYLSMADPRGLYLIHKNCFDVVNFCSLLTNMLRLKFLRIKTLKK